MGGVLEGLWGHYEAPRAGLACDMWAAKALDVFVTSARAAIVPRDSRTQRSSPTRRRRAEMSRELSRSHRP
jgi:hypothetical protein